MSHAPALGFGLMLDGLSERKVCNQYSALDYQGNLETLWIILMCCNMLIKAISSIVSLACYFTLCFGLWRDLAGNGMCLTL